MTDPANLDEDVDHALVRTGLTDEMAFLASDEARFVSGSQHLVDGGAATKRYPDVRKLLEQSL